ncbi:MAG: hypothetical protein WA786_08455 [Acidimicrobiales bacterium]
MTASPAQPGDTFGELEESALTSLFPRVTAVTIVVFVSFIAVRGTAGSKTWDWTAFAIALLGAALLGLRFLRRPTIDPSRLALVVSTVGMFSGIAFIERPELTHYFWEGFGFSVALLALPLSFFVVPLSTRLAVLAQDLCTVKSRILAVCANIVLSAIAITVAISFIRDLSDFSDAGNNSYILNEVLAPVAGRIPAANFVPQYTSLIGWLVVPFHHLVSANQLADFSSILVSCLGIVAVALSVILAKRCFPSRSMWIVLAIIIPLAGVTVRHFGIPNAPIGFDSADSSIASSLQEYPLRMFPAMLFSVVGVGSLVSLMENSVRKLVLISLGVGAGLMVWNSQDVGLAVVIAYFAVLLIATRGATRRRATALWFSGLAPGLLLYPLWAVLIGQPVHWTYLGLAARSYGAGFGEALMQDPGPVLLVLPLLIGSAVVGVFLLWRTIDSSSVRSKHQSFAIAILALVGAWSVASLPYYVNRSYASGQLQVFLLPFSVCCCALLSLCLPVTSDANGLRSEVNCYLRKRALWLLPVTLPIAVGLAASLQLPSPAAALDRLVHPPASVGFSVYVRHQAVSSHEITVSKTYAKDHGGGVVGYFGPDANYLELADNLQPRILFDSPGLLRYGSRALKLGCDYVRKDPSRWLIVAPGSMAIVGPSICGIYQPRSVPGLSRDTLFKLHDA